MCWCSVLKLLAFAFAELVAKLSARDTWDAEPVQAYEPRSGTGVQVGEVKLRRLVAEVSSWSVYVSCASGLLCIAQQMTSSGHMGRSQASWNEVCEVTPEKDM